MFAQLCKGDYAETTLLTRLRRYSVLFSRARTEAQTNKSSVHQEAELFVAQTVSSVLLSPTVRGRERGREIGIWIGRQKGTDK